MLRWFQQLLGHRRSLASIGTRWPEIIDAMPDPVLGLRYGDAIALHNLGGTACSVELPQDRTWKVAFGRGEVTGGRTTLSRHGSVWLDGLHGDENRAQWVREGS